MESKRVYKGSDRRRDYRLKQNVAAEFVFINGAGSLGLSKKHAGIIHDISAGGCCLELKDLNEAWREDLFSGLIKIALKIKLPGTEKSVTCIAKLIWLSKLWKEKELKKRKKETRKYMMGLKFVDIATSTQERIQSYIIKSFFS